MSHDYLLLFVNFLVPLSTVSYYSYQLFPITVSCFSHVVFRGRLKMLNSRQSTTCARSETDPTRHWHTPRMSPCVWEARLSGIQAYSGTTSSRLPAPRYSYGSVRSASRPCPAAPDGDAEPLLVFGYYHPDALADAASGQRCTYRCSFISPMICVQFWEEEQLPLEMMHRHTQFIEPKLINNNNNSYLRFIRKW